MKWWELIPKPPRELRRLAVDDKDARISWAIGIGLLTEEQVDLLEDDAQINDISAASSLEELLA